MRRASHVILEMGSKAVLLKGGHLKGETLIDILVNKDSEKIYSGPRLITKHTHGTGCSMASAIATGVAQGNTLEMATQRARDYVFTAIKTAPQFGKGHGPLNHAHTVMQNEQN